MLVERNVPLQAHNTFGISAKALQLVRVQSEADIQALLADPQLSDTQKFVLGGGSNIVLTGDVKALVLKVEFKGMRLVQETEKAWIVEAAAGEDWHDFVQWTLDNRWPGLENMALIPGSVGASPVQNIGAYGVELQDRFDALDAIDLATGNTFTLDAAQCAFGYRDSIFKHGPGQTVGASRSMGLAGRALITRVRFRLAKAWKPVLGYLDLEKKMAETGIRQPTAQQIFEWVCAIRRSKLPDPTVIGNAGSFFKNPTVTPEQCADIIARDPKVVHYLLDDGRIKLAAGWLIDACGWKGKSVGNAAVYEKQALVLVNYGGATGEEVISLANNIINSVKEKFDLELVSEVNIV